MRHMYILVSLNILLIKPGTAVKKARLIALEIEIIKIHL